MCLNLCLSMCRIQYVWTGLCKTCTVVGVCITDYVHRIVCLCFRKVAQWEYVCVFNFCPVWMVNSLRLCCDSLINDPELDLKQQATGWGHKPLFFSSSSHLVSLSLDLFSLLPCISNYCLPLSVLLSLILCLHLPTFTFLFPSLLICLSQNYFCLFILFLPLHFSFPIYFLLTLRFLDCSTQYVCM